MLTTACLPARRAKDAKAAPVEADGPPIEAVILLGVGEDLEAPPSPTDEGEGGGPASPARADGLVHLRDGKVLGDYGVPNEAVIYIVLEGRG